MKTLAYEPDIKSINVNSTSNIYIVCSWDKTNALHTIGVLITNICGPTELFLTPFGAHNWSNKGRGMYYPVWE